MQITIASLTFLAGLALIIVGIFGGGIEVKEVKIPTLPTVPRITSIVVGCLLVGVYFWNPFPQPPNPNAAEAVNIVNKQPPCFGAAITTHLITVHDVKIILKHLKRYEGPMDDQPNDSYCQAVAAFQASQSIDQDGLVGPQTLAKLQAAWPDFFNPK